MFNVLVSKSFALFLLPTDKGIITSGPASPARICCGAVKKPPSAFAAAPPPPPKPVIDDPMLANAENFSLIGPMILLSNQPTRPLHAPLMAPTALVNADVIVSVTPPTALEIGDHTVLSNQLAAGENTADTPSHA